MTVRPAASWLATLGLGVLLLSVSGTAAQTLPAEPIAIANGRVTVGGDVSATYGSEDPGFFNFTDYDHSALRMLRIDVAATAKIGPHLALLGEVRTENVDSLRPYALYARIRPWTNRDVDIQVGRIPPTFGAFARRTYAVDNPLIGYPLAYQYLTSMRPDSLPATADEILQKRSHGWRLRYSIGDPNPDRGVPLVSAFRWDTGVQVHGATGMVSGALAVTTGTISNPLFSDDNGGRQIAGRVEAKPVAGLVLGGSFAHGPFVGASAARLAVGDTPGVDPNRFTQSAWGADVEYSRHYYLFRMETIVSDWQIPLAKTPLWDHPLRAVSTSVEGRYKIATGMYVAARVDHLGFSDVTGSTLVASWDAPVTRDEIAVGYSIQRNLLLKVAYQYNHRDGGGLPSETFSLKSVEHLGAAQLVFWF
jgi:hypothetical protein